MRTGTSSYGCNLLKTTSSNAMHFILPALPSHHQTAKFHIWLSSSSFPSDTRTPRKSSLVGDRFYCNLYNQVNESLLDGMAHFTVGTMLVELTFTNFGLG